MNSDDHESRISRLEQRMDDHLRHAAERFDRNDADHDKIYRELKPMSQKLETVERYILKREAFFLGIFFVIGGTIGFVVSKWDWIINRFGHH